MGEDLYETAGLNDVGIYYKIFLREYNPTVCFANKNTQRKWYWFA